MQFQNLQVHWEALPKAADVHLKPIDKNYLKVLYITWSIMYVIILAVVITIILLIEDIDHYLWLPAGIAAILLLAAATFIIGTGSFKRKAYAVREKDILFRTGWIIQKLHIVPFNRVQHCVVQSGPIGRRYGLATVIIYTAASNEQDISINGLKSEDAEVLKTFILEQIQPLT
jgi:uncharacterized protein